MTKENHTGLFLPSGCLRYDTVEAYLDGKLDSSGKSAADAHIAECDLCREAVEGLGGARKSVDINNVVGSLNSALLKRAAEKKQDQGLPPRVSRGTRWAWVSAAASVIIIGLFSFYFLNLHRLPFNDVAEGYVPVGVDQPDIFRLPEPRLEMETWNEFDDSEIRRDIAITEEDVVVEDEVEIAEEAIPEMEADLIPENQDVPGNMGIADAGDDTVLKDEASPAGVAVSREALVKSVQAGQEKITRLDGETVSAKKSPASVESAEISTLNEVTVVSRGQDDFVSEELRFTPVEPEPIYTVAEQMPRFPGGEEALLRYLEKNYELPAEFLGSGIDTSIYISFVVDPNGKTRMINVTRGISNKADRMAVRLIRRMPVWEPGMQRGQEVAVRMNLAVPVKSPGEDQ